MLPVKEKESRAPLDWSSEANSSIVVDAKWDAIGKIVFSVQDLVIVHVEDTAVHRVTTGLCDSAVLSRPWELSGTIR